MDNKSLVENHLYFLSTHRGRRETTPVAEYIHSDMFFFNIAIPSKAGNIKTIPSDFLIYAYDFIPGKIIGDLKHFTKLSYMALTEYDNIKTVDENVLIKKAETEKDMEDFSFAQAKGFAMMEEDLDDWYPWLLKQNMKNLNKENQSFYLGYINDKPVATGLCITHENIAGIYAVATIPEFRKQGISTSIMKKVIEDASAKKVDGITLQVEADSYANKFYRDLGFKDAFHCTIYKKEKVK